MSDPGSWYFISAGAAVMWITLAPFYGEDRLLIEPAPPSNRLARSRAAPSFSEGACVSGSRASEVARGRVELRSVREKTSPRHKVHFQPDAVWVLEQYVVIAWCPTPFHWAANDRRVHLFEQSSAS